MAFLRRLRRSARCALTCVAALSVVPGALASEALPLAAADQTCRRVADRLASVDPRWCAIPELRASDTASVEGLPILYADLPAADPGRAPRVLLFGGIHGDELSSVSIVFGFLDELAARDARSVHWRVVPVLNPDGLLRRPATRGNARGVDLNRNFPSPDWQRRAKTYWRHATGSDPRRYPGAAAMSEPESRWLVAQIMAFAPDVVVAMHAPLGLLDFDGRTEEAPHRLGFLDLQTLGTYPGSLGEWAGEHLGIPVVTPELPYAGIMPTPGEIDALWRDLEDWIARRARERGALFAGDTDVPSPVVRVTEGVRLDLPGLPLLPAGAR